MSSVVAMTYRGEICLASDVMSKDHETGERIEDVIKQMTIKDRIAIGFTGFGNIAQVIMKTLQNPKNSDIVSKTNISEIPALLDYIYSSYISREQYPDKENIHLSALIIGMDRGEPEIIQWDSVGPREITHQGHHDNFTAKILAPYDVTEEMCYDILSKSADENAQYISMKRVAIDYFKAISSISKYVSETATIWSKQYIITW